MYHLTLRELLHLLMEPTHWQLSFHFFYVHKKTWNAVQPFDRSSCFKVNWFGTLLHVENPFTAVSRLVFYWIMVRRCMYTKGGDLMSHPRILPTTKMGELYYFKRKLSAIRRMNVYQQDRYSLQSICPTSTHTFCHLILWKMATCNYSSYKKKCIHSSPKGDKPEVLSVIVSMCKFRVFRWHPFFL